MINSTSVNMTWSLPEPGSRNGIIRGFKIFYSKTGDSGTAKVQDIKGNTTLNLILTPSGFEHSSAYSFSILAYTVSDGPISTVVMTTNTLKGKYKWDKKLENWKQTTFAILTLSKLVATILSSFFYFIIYYIPLDEYSYIHRSPVTFSKWLPQHWTYYWEIYIKTQVFYVKKSSSLLIQMLCLLINATLNLFYRVLHEQYAVWREQLKIWR
jgi:hypothetical protein